MIRARGTERGDCGVPSVASPFTRYPLGRFRSCFIGAALLAVSAAGCTSSSSSGSDLSRKHEVIPVDVACSSIEEPKVIHRVEPRYPEDLRRRRIHGRVEVKGIIGKDGALSDLRVESSSSPALSELVLEAVIQWRYKPAYCNDLAQPIRVYVTVTSRFRLDS